MTALRRRDAVLALALVLALATVLARAADPRSFFEGNYGTSGLPHTDLSGSPSGWDYTNLNAWPEVCRTGSRQSPISFNNVDPSEVVKDAPLARLRFSRKCFFPKDETQMRIVNEGAVNMVSFERQGRLPEDLSECTVVDPLDKTRVYYFTELHFHATSEHKFRNLRPDVEMHLTFTTDTSKGKKKDVLMVAVMLKASTTINSTSVRALRHILVDGSLPRRHAMTTCFLTEDMSITSLLPTRESYLLYDGSETHPPCTENVRWVVMTSPILISRVAVGKLRDAMDELLPNDFHRYGNARPPQALNGRRIYRFDDESVPAGGLRSEGNLDDAWSRHKRGEGAGNETAGAGGNYGRLLDDSNDDRIYSEGEPWETEPPATQTPTSANESATTSTAVPTPGEENATAAAANTSSTSAAPAETTPADGDSVTEEYSTNSTAAPGDDGGNTTAGAATDAAASSAAVAAVAAANGDGNATTNTTASAASSEPATTTTTTSSSTSTTTTTTTTTKKPASHKGKKGRGPTSKNVSDSPSDSAAAAADSDATDGLQAAASGAWARAKDYVSRATATSSAYLEAHPYRGGAVVLGIVTLFFLIVTCIRGWRKPVYVVGIDPSELQPLNASSAFGQYGGTAPASVRPSRRPAE